MMFHMSAIYPPFSFGRPFFISVTASLIVGKHPSCRHLNDLRRPLRDLPQICLGFNLILFISVEEHPGYPVMAFVYHVRNPQDLCNGDDMIISDHACVLSDRVNEGRCLHLG